MSLGADVLKEHHQPQAKGNYWINAWTARRSVALLHQCPDERKVESRLQMVEAIFGNELFEGEY